jgi:hypothetical protein
VVIDAEAQLVCCTEAGGQTPAEPVARCESTTAKSLAKFVAKRVDCYGDCFAAAVIGGAVDGQVQNAACTD